MGERETTSVTENFSSRFFPSQGRKKIRHHEGEGVMPEECHELYIL